MPDERRGAGDDTRRVGSTALLLVLLAGAAACGDSGQTSNCEPRCSIHEMCVNGLCVPIDAGLDVLEVVDDAGETADVEPEAEAVVDVPAEEVGPEDVGREDGTPGEYNIGDPCTEATECRGPGEPTCVTAIVVFGNPWEWPGGYCTSTCDAADVESCGPGNLCLSIPLVGWNGCLRECTPGVPDDCRETEGYQCLDPASIPGGIVPAPFCAPQLF
jgi:hypothetical protein